MASTIKARVSTASDREIMDIVNDVQISPAAKQTILSSLLYSFFVDTITTYSNNTSISDICNLCQFVDIGVYVNAPDKDIALELLSKQIKQILESTCHLSGCRVSSNSIDEKIENFILQVRELLK